MHLTEVWRRAGDKPFDNLVQHDGLRSVHFEKCRGVHVDSDEDHTWVVSGAMPGIAFLGEPRLPIARIELVDPVPVTRDAGDSGDGYPLARTIFVVRQIDVRVCGDVLQVSVRPPA